MPTLPTSGQTAWDTPLDAYLTALNTEETSTASNLANHVANAPADPHGDRAFAQSLVNPLTTGINQPNGLVQLNSSGHIPATLITGSSVTGGLYTNVIDAVAQYGAFTGSNDTSTQIQNALNAAATAGGGIVYLAPGTYSLANYLVIGNNTWFLMGQGTKLQRIQGGTTPAYLISNVQFGTTNTPSTQFKISGGILDAIGSQNLSNACTPIMMVQAEGSVVNDMLINNVNANPAVEVNGSSYIVLQDLQFTGPGSNFGGLSSVPAVRLNSTSSSTTPTGLAGGLYNNAVCSNISMINCSIVANSHTYMSYGLLIGSDKYHSPYNHSTIAITSCSTNNASNSGEPINPTNWNNWSWSGCIFPDQLVPASAVDTIQAISVGGSPSWSGTLFYYMNPDGSVVLYGSLTAPSSTPVNNNTFAQLPSRYRPNFGINFPIASSSGTNAVCVVGSDGTIHTNGVSSPNSTVTIGPVVLPVVF